MEEYICPECGNTSRTPGNCPLCEVAMEKLGQVDPLGPQTYPKSLIESDLTQPKDWDEEADSNQ